MWFKAVTFLGLFLGAMCAEMSAIPPSPIPVRPVEPEWKAPEAYLELRRHDIISRDHGCTDFPEDIEQSYHCVDIWFKNRFSEANPAIAPAAVYTEFQYHDTEHSWKPVVTWVENINPWRARACAAAPGGMKGTLDEGKMRWFAIYNTQPQSNTEQYGRIAYNVASQPLTTQSHCFHYNFPIAFASQPIINLQLKLRYGLKSSEEAMAIWAKGVTATGMEICMEEFYAWSRYHYEYDIDWYAIAAAHSQDRYATHGKVVFNAGDLYPTDHNQLNYFFCQNVTIPRLYPCPAVLLQPVEPSMAVCQTTIVAWIAHLEDDLATICYADKRGIMKKRKVDVEVHYILYGHPDKCASLTCPLNQECIHPTWDTVRCGCFKDCPDDGEEVCGTNMKTYENRCELDKAACESGFKFSYAHHGECEEYTLDHGRDQLVAEPNCEGLYCKVISTRNNVWYADTPINVQITVNWMNNIGGEMPSTHDATSSWVEDVKPESFRACVMEAGRRTLLQGPHINWLAYQGKAPEMKSHKIDVGEWRSGTHCVPVHERKVLEKPMHFHPPSCPSTDLRDSPKSDKEKWQYDSHVMSEIFGQQQKEWMKRMMMGYGVKRMNLTSGMEIMNATLMMTVEHTATKTRSAPQDAVNVWMEYDGATQEAYVCLREMSNWDGLHTGIHVHWTFFNHSMIHDVGFSHQLHFKPHYMAPMYSNYAFCQTKGYLPDNFTLVDSATVLVSLSHRIPAHSAFESIKKYKLHQKEVMKGMPMGDFDFNKKEVQASWMLPHMWRSNLSGWRPHMRINKNADYSAWVEGMNSTHIKVCQKSLYSGFHYEGVKVSLFVLPDRCPAGYRYLNSGMCGKYVAPCAIRTNAAQSCGLESAFVAAPENPRDNYWVSYLAGQSSVHLAKSDSAQEGQFVRDLGNPSTSDYFRWKYGYPAQASSLSDCSVQEGRGSDFGEIDALCTSCYPYVCIKPAPYLSCGFRKPGYCNNNGKCNYVSPFQYSCHCMPPYSGNRCQNKP